LHRSAVQDVPIEAFDVLDNGDILFIDSTHLSEPDNAGTDRIWQKHPEVVRRFLPEGNNDAPGSIWLRRVA
jgi:hypothetical protein